MIHMAAQLKSGIDIFTVDTGLLFEETLALRATFQERYEINLKTFTPELSVVEQAELHGDKLWEIDSDACCAMRKVEPTKRALDGLNAWVAALRRDQSPSRANIRIFEYLEHEDGSPLVKIHPLANWNRVDTWRYVLDNDVPYNPLLNEGYKSVGCHPCTAAVGAGEDERAGRWGGRKAECGIHTMVGTPIEPSTLVRPRKTDTPPEGGV